MGGRGGSLNSEKATQATEARSMLEAFREDTAKLLNAKEAAQNTNIGGRRPGIFEYTGIDGKKRRFYWNGASYVDRKSALRGDNRTADNWIYNGNTGEVTTTDGNKVKNLGSMGNWLFNE